MATCPAHSNCDAWRDFRTPTDIEPKLRPPAPSPPRYTLLLIGMISNEVRHFRLFCEPRSIAYLGRVTPYLSSLSTYVAKIAY